MHYTSACVTKTELSHITVDFGTETGERSSVWRPPCQSHQWEMQTLTRSQRPSSETARRRQERSEQSPRRRLPKAGFVTAWSRSAAAHATAPFPWFITPWTSVTDALAGGFQRLNYRFTSLHHLQKSCRLLHRHSFTLVQILRCLSI